MVGQMVVVCWIRARKSWVVEIWLQGVSSCSLEGSLSQNCLMRIRKEREILTGKSYRYEQWQGC